MGNLGQFNKDIYKPLCGITERFSLGRISEETHLDKNEKLCYSYDVLNRVTARTVKNAIPKFLKSFYQKVGELYIYGEEFYYMRTLDKITIDHFKLSDQNDERLLLELYYEIQKECPITIINGYYKDVSIIEPCDLGGIDLKIPGAGKIAAKYINNFKSEKARSYLFHFMTDEKEKHYGKLFLDLYYKFRESSDHYSFNSNIYSNHLFIVCRYDIALSKTLTRDMVPGLIELAKDPIDIAGLQRCLSKVASKFHPEELEEISTKYILTRNNVWEHKKYESSWDAHFDCTPIYVSMRCLEHYPSQSNIEIISKYINDENFFIDKYTARLAQKSIDKINKAINKR